MVVQTVVLYVKLPRFKLSAGLPYPKLLASTVAIARGEPVLRRRALYGLLSFASFSVLWTTLAFLLAGPPFGYSDGVIGLFGLVGVAGAVTASVVGRFTDRGWVYWLTGGSCALMLLGFVFLWLGGSRWRRWSSASWSWTSAPAACTSATRARSTGCGRRRGTASTRST